MDKRCWPGPAGAALCMASPFSSGPALARIQASTLGIAEARANDAPARAKPGNVPFPCVEVLAAFARKCLTALSIATRKFDFRGGIRL